MPNITGGVLTALDNSYVDGAIVSGYTDEWGGTVRGVARHWNYLNASKSNAIYGSSETVTPLSQSTLMLIKY